MANNRMYLKCNGCGKAIFLGKHFGDPWYISKDKDEIDSFFRRHYDHTEDLCMHGNDFSLVYENTDEFEIEYINETPDYVKEEIRAWNEYIEAWNKRVSE